MVPVDVVDDVPAGSQFVYESLGLVDPSDFIGNERREWFTNPAVGLSPALLQHARALVDKPAVWGVRDQSLRLIALFGQHHHRSLVCAVSDAALRYLQLNLGRSHGCLQYRSKAGIVVLDGGRE